MKIFHHYLKNTIIVAFAVLMTQMGPVTLAETTDSEGIIEGRFVWADNSPVREARVKLFDKLEVFSGYSSQNFGLKVQQIAIARDANVWELDVDKTGSFKFSGLPSGSYYLFFRIPKSFEGDEWIYQYHQPANIFYLAGHMSKPDEYKVVKGGKTKIPDIEVLKRINSKTPILAGDKAGVYRFEWSTEDMSTPFTLTIKHTDVASQNSPVYGEHKISGGEYLVPDKYPLASGPHKFKVESLTKTLRVLGRSEWIEFTVP